MGSQRALAVSQLVATGVSEEEERLLVIRDMMFFGKQRFEEFLESPEGISPNIFTNRRKFLEEADLVEKQPYSNHPRRMNYQLTERGKSLRPVLKTMIAWGLKNIPDTMIPDDKESQRLFEK